MKTALPVIMLCLLGLTACDGSGDEFNDNIFSRAAPKLRIFPDDSDIIAKVYDNHYQVPGDFFVDERATTPGTFSFYHVKDISVSYELCTNEYQEALDWEAADNSSRAAGGEFVGSFENDKYFEFARELTVPDSVGNIANATSSGFARIFKCNYVDRVGVDRNLRNGYAGTINRSPLSSAVIRDYSQYMWQFTFFWPAEKNGVGNIFYRASKRLSAHASACACD